MKHHFLSLTLLILSLTACHDRDKKPSIFQVFEGNFLAQDTAVQRAIVWDSQFSNHLEILPPVANGIKKISLDLIPEQAIEVYNQDTTTLMLLSIEAGDSYKVSINQKGEFTWSDGTYIAPLSITGFVIGDSIRFSAIRFNGFSGEYSGNNYLGVRE